MVSCIWVECRVVRQTNSSMNTSCSSLAICLLRQQTGRPRIRRTAMSWSSRHRGIERLLRWENTIMFLVLRRYLITLVPITDRNLSFYYTFILSLPLLLPCVTVHSSSLLPCSKLPFYATMCTLASLIRWAVLHLLIVRLHPTQHPHVPTLGSKTTHTIPRLN
jgi:hypothetical protein